MNEQTALAPVQASTGPNGQLDLMTLGKMLAASGYFSDAKQTAQAIVKILAGRELGLGEIQAMTNIHVIEGKIAVGASAIAVLIRRSGRYDYRIVEHDEQRCDIEFLCQGKPIGRSVFTMQDAARAGLTGKGARMWEKYPRNMLFARAISNGARWYCPDVFGGAVYTPDELSGDAVDADWKPASGESLPAPVPTKQIAAPAKPVATQPASPAPAAVEPDDPPGLAYFDEPAPAPTAAPTRPAERTREDALADLDMIAERAEAVSIYVPSPPDDATGQQIDLYAVRWRKLVSKAEQNKSFAEALSDWTVAAGEARDLGLPVESVKSDVQVTGLAVATNGLQQAVHAELERRQGTMLVAGEVPA